MNKVAQFYRELVATLTERLRNGERDIDALVDQARLRVMQTGELTRTEVEEVTRAVRRDLEEFARSYEESQDEVADSVFMRVIKESVWQEAYTTVERSLGWEIWSAKNVTSIWPFTPRISCHCAPNAVMTSSSVARLNLNRDHHDASDDASW